MARQAETRQQEMYLIGSIYRSYYMLSVFKLSSSFILRRSLHHASFVNVRNQAAPLWPYIADNIVIELKWINLTMANMTRVLNSFLNDCCTHY